MKLREYYDGGNSLPLAFIHDVQLFENCKDSQYDHDLIPSLGKVETVPQQDSSFQPEHCLQLDQRLLISQVV
jgi:hypothetical protein